METGYRHNQQVNKITTALLMAAGMGTRIRPISEKIPKPLIPVHGTPIIETLIEAILLAGIQKIIITVGYQKDKYLYLKEKYNNIILVENKDYLSRNTISSFYAAMDYLRNENCLICESDLYIVDSSIIKGEMDKSRYLMRDVPPQNYEWGFDLQNDQVKRVVRPKRDILLDHHMYGIAYWMKDDLEKLIDAVNTSYHKVGYEQLAYDEVANEIFDKIDMGVIRVNDGQLYEIDCLQDLVRVDPAYNTYLHYDLKERRSKMMENEWANVLDKKHIDTFCNVLGITIDKIEKIYVNPGRSANNSNFVIVANKQSYLYRVPGPGTEKFCSRSREALAYRLLAPFKITDDVIFLSEDTGIKISKYYEESRIPSSTDKDELVASMHILRKLHSQNIDFPFVDTLFDRMERYRTYVYEVGGEKYYLDGFDGYLAEMRHFKQYLDSVDIKFCFTHGDASINNLLVTKEYPHPILIDMEFPAMADPFEDIATFCVDAEYRKNDILLMLEYYLDRKSTLEEQYHILGLCAMAAMMWYSWAVYKLAVEDDNQLFLDFRDAYHRYVGEVYKDALKTLNKMEQEGLLEQAAAHQDEDIS